MKAVTLAFMALALTVLACDDNDVEQPELMQGTYTGEFRRSSPVGDWMVAKVTLIFDDGSFSGESDHEKYPAICHGTYVVKAASIDFENKCAWTAEFDWTFILDGEFTIENEGNDLILTRQYSEHTFDRYVLRRQ